MFKIETTKTDKLSKIIETDKPLHIVTKKVLKRLQGFVHQSCKKVKIVEKVDQQLEALYNKRRLLRTLTDDKSVEELEEVENELSEKYSEVMCKKILGEIKDIGDSADGGFSSAKLWKLKKKISPRLSEPPSAMKNAEGKLLTSDKDILNEAVKHYKKVFEPTQIKDSLEHVQKARETLCDERLAEASTCKTPPWSVEDVKNVLKQLKPGKSKDPYDFPNEIFRPDVAWEDLI